MDFFWSVFGWTVSISADTAQCTSLSLYGIGWTTLAPRRTVTTIGVCGKNRVGSYNKYKTRPFKKHTFRASTTADNYIFLVSHFTKVHTRTNSSSLVTVRCTISGGFLVMVMTVVTVMMALLMRNSTAASSCRTDQWLGRICRESKGRQVYDDKYDGEIPLLRTH